MSELILTPAYGRDYRNKADALADYNAGKDFIIANFNHPYSGKPISVRDVPSGDAVKIRYDKLRKIVFA